MPLIDRSLCVLGSLLFVLSACDCGGGDPAVGDPCTAPGQCGPTLVCTSNRCAEPSDAMVMDAAMDATTDGSADAAHDALANDMSITSIELSGAPPTLDVTLGQPNSSITFAVTANLANGSEMSVPVVTYETSNVAPGVVDGNGTYQANATVGGSVTITATVVATNGTFTASQSFNVRLVSTTGAGSGPGSPGVLFGATPVTDGAADAEIF